MHYGKLSDMIKLMTLDMISWSFEIEIDLSKLLNLFYFLFTLYAQKGKCHVYIIYLWMVCGCVVVG